MLPTDNPLLLNKRSGLDYFGRLLDAANVSNRQAIVQAAEDAISGRDGALAALERQWYASLGNTPDYSLYELPIYLAEVWHCWHTYSRKYLREICKPRSYAPEGVYGDLREVRSIVDVGNGIGVTTAALRSLFPTADVYGTNVEASEQLRIAKALSEVHGFTMTVDIRQVGKPVDLVFASEYFEHFQDPIGHLQEIVEAVAPRRWLIANTFGGPATGHFPQYLIDGAPVDGMTMSRAFGAAMRRLGYVKVKTSMWNNRPAYWKSDGAEL